VHTWYAKRGSLKPFSGEKFEFLRKTTNLHKSKTKIRNKYEMRRSPPAFLDFFRTLMQFLRKFFGLFLSRTLLFAKKNRYETYGRVKTGKQFFFKFKKEKETYQIVTSRFK